MRVLVIDTATQALSIALLDEGQVVESFHEIVGRGHAEALIPAISHFPNGGLADAIAVDVGPGSFTGVRIGIAAARALAMAWNIPVSGFSGIPLIAAQAAKSHEDGDIYVTITGGHGELFWQRFSKDGMTALTNLQSTPIAELAATINSEIFYGTGAEALVTARGKGTAVNLYPDAKSFELIRILPPLPTRPIYGREADAKPQLEAKGA